MNKILLRNKRKRLLFKLKIVYICNIIILREGGKEEFFSLFLWFEKRERENKIVYKAT